MALLEWKDSLSVSIPKFDEQHKKFISLINELHSAMSTGKGKGVMEKILTELVNYTKTHFAEEEAEFKKHGYPEAFFHQKEHEKLTKEVLKFYDEFMSGKTSITIEVLSFLTNWLQKHIMGTDLKYVPFLKAKGVK